MKDGVRMKLSLKIQLLISYGLMALFLIGSLLLVSNYMLEHHFQSYIQQKQEQINQNLVASVLDEFVSHGEASNTFLNKLGQDALKDGIMLMVNDKTGKQLYCADCEHKESCDMMAGMMRDTMRTRYADWEGEYTEKEYPLEQNGQNYGTVRLGYYGPFFFSEADLQFIGMLNTLSVVTASVLFAVALALGAFLAVRIAKPIKYVIDRTHEIEKNQYSERIDFVSGTKEMDQLIGSVNTLANTLEMQQQIKKRMAGDYAHEFRTPLASLQSNLEGMIDGIFEATPERLESCRAEVLRLARMTTQIDRLVELENSNLLLNKEAFDFSALLAQSAMPFEKELHDKQITLELNTPECNIYADRDKISQVMANLLSNAVKYTNEGGHIRASVEDHGDFVKFILSDNGDGIEAADLPYIFEYLYRTDRSRARGTGGSGIGLSVVKAIVSAHKGQIEVASEFGVGSRFIVTISKK